MTYGSIDSATLTEAGICDVEPGGQPPGNVSADDRPRKRAKRPELGLGAGSVFAHYELIRELGRGGMGTVFLARDTRLGRLVAIKFLAHKEQARKRFLAEARTTALCKHDNIVVIHDIGVEKEHWYMVFEYLTGVTLREWLRQRWPKSARVAATESGPIEASVSRVSVAMAVDIALPIVRALEHAHRLGLIHRDLKPENIMITEDGAVKVLDFGIAVMLEPSDELARAPSARAPSKTRRADAAPPTDTAKADTAKADTAKADTAKADTAKADTAKADTAKADTAKADTAKADTAKADTAKDTANASTDHASASVGLLRYSRTSPPSTLVGTLPYMSPEQRGVDSIDERCDVWAMGIILWELLTGRHPLAPVSIEELAMIRDMSVPMPSLAEIRPDLGLLGHIVDRCLHKAKSERMPSAAALGHELARLKHETGPATPGEPGEPDNPYAGLAAFQEADAGRFFGRERDIAAILTRLRNRCMVTVTGPSGSGKSSFVRAGVIPALKRLGQNWHVVTIRPGRRPLSALVDIAAQFGGIYGNTNGNANSTGAGLRATDAWLEISQQLRAQPGHLGIVLRAHCREHQRRIVLFIDQFEELYTMATTDADRARFVACLEGVADDASSPLRVVLAMRSDFLDRVAEDRSFAASITRSLMLLPRLHRDELRSVLTRPLATIDYAFEPETGLVDTMLDELEHTRGELPLLQFTAARLWGLRDRKRRLLTAASYRDIGGVAGALASHADQVVASMSVPQRDMARSICERLVTPEGTRAIASMNELRQLADDQSDVETVLQQLSDARLVIVELEERPEQSTSKRSSRSRLPGGSVELIHESLIHGWPTLRRWLDENHDDQAFLARLRTSAAAWQRSGRALAGLLWRGDALLEYRLWQARYRGPLTDDERAFVRASVRDEERGKRRKKLLLLAAFAVLLIGFVAILRLERIATSEQERAQAFAVQSEGRLLDMYQEQGRLALLRGEPQPAMVYFTEARRKGRQGRDLDFLLGRANDALADQLLVLRAESSLVWALAYSPDGALIASGGTDGAVDIWDARTSQQMHALSGHELDVWQVAFNPDGSRLVSVSWDGTARVWTMPGGDLAWVARHDDSLKWAGFNRDGTLLGTASMDRSVKIWDADTGALRRTLTGQHGFHKAAFTPDGAALVTVDHGGKVQRWDLTTGIARTLDVHQTLAWDIDISPDGEALVTAANAPIARIVAVNGEYSLALTGHDAAIVRARFSPDGRRVVTASEDWTARVWNARTGALEFKVTRHEGGVTDARFTSDGRHLVTISRDGSAMLWDAGSGQHVWTFFGHKGGLWTGELSPTGDRLATAGFDGTVRVWRADSSAHELTLPARDTEVRHVAPSPDGKRVATARVASSGDKVVVDIWQLPDRFMASFEAPFAAVPIPLPHVEWSGDGTRVVASGGSAAVIWDINSGAEIARVSEHGSRTRHAIFTGDDAAVLTAGEDGSVQMWSVPDRRRQLDLVGHDEPVNFISISPDGERIATASRDQTVRIWAAATGEVLQVLARTPAHVVNSVRFSSDGRRVITASEDETAFVWTIATGQTVSELEGHSGSIRDAAFSPDDTLAATGGDDGTVRIWDVATSTLLWSSEARVAATWTVQFSRDGRQLWTAQGNRGLAWNTAYETRGADELHRLGMCRTGYLLKGIQLERLDARAADMCSD